MARNRHGKSGANRQAMAASSLEQLYALALDHVEQSQPAEALVVAKQLWGLVKDRPSAIQKLPALNLLGDISIELGAVDSARGYFELAVRLDPEGQVPEALGGGAEKFLWLAQLCDEGGKQSVEWFEKGVQALQTEIAAIEGGGITGLSEEQLLLMRVEKKRKLANALCGIVEVYMTDLSWEGDAEARCESLVTQAMTVEDETSPEVLQTLASVRLSQERKEDAQSALKRSLETWIELESEDEAVPDFPTKISLARLLMEADLLDQAMQVCHRLIQEDDQSVEAWYLGGWCQYLLAQHNKADNDLANDSAMDTGAGDQSAAVYHRALKGSRRWLKMSTKLYERQQYEDDRLFEHAEELVAGLDTVLGPEDEQAEGGVEDDEDEWEGIEDDHAGEDEEMQDS
ncbi:hypothetical protein DOTSEDRAFT_68349 [Dothistroma septosporum NZE10]|uniref:Uncharacterized protein n=1 Tax=Dothistroma septosporum (strain NZE10 / CBS 128990) TaxID=675120 RepID=N1Q4J1_DOTSN|nr:hypothetical protein DOTSEDRAFT_68349 [Dothistroma septosporum NZE10]